MLRRPTDPAPVLVRRFVQLFVGLFLYGMGIALIVRGELGVAPWDVLTQGIAKQTGLNFGLITVITSGIVLLLWIPIRQKPGFGTVMNALLVGPAADVGLWLIPPGLDLWVRILLLRRRHRRARRRDRPLHRRALRPRPARRPHDRACTGSPDGASGSCAPASSSWCSRSAGCSAATSASAPSPSRCSSARSAGTRSPSSRSGAPAGCPPTASAPASHRAHRRVEAHPRRRDAGRRVTGLTPVARAGTPGTPHRDDEAPSGSSGRGLARRRTRYRLRSA